MIISVLKTFDNLEVSGFEIIKISFFNFKITPKHVEFVFTIMNLNDKMYIYI